MESKAEWQALERLILKKATEITSYINISRQANEQIALCSKAVKDLVQAANMAAAVAAMKESPEPEACMTEIRGFEYGPETADPEDYHGE